MLYAVHCFQHKIHFNMQKIKIKIYKSKKIKKNQKIVFVYISELCALLGQKNEFGHFWGEGYAIMHVVNWE